MNKENLLARAKASGLHFLFSLAVAALAGWAILSLWYPKPFDHLAGGRGLFGLVVSVDVVMGPLLTFVAFNLKKPRKELIRDLAIIVVLQLGALAYGFYTVYIVRPVALVYEGGRFRSVVANDVWQPGFAKAKAPFNALSLRGPRVYSVRESTSEEKLASIDLAMKGFDTGQRPNYWQSYASSQSKAWNEAKPIGDLLKKHPEHQSLVLKTLKDQGLSLEQTRLLPILARAPNWSVLLKPGGEIAGYIPVDGFF